MDPLQEIHFFINNDKQSVRLSNFPPNTTLNQYLRNHLYLTGSKKMCLKGGCGSCVVSLTKRHPRDNKTIAISVNSCLVNLISCNNWKIETVEGIGNRLKGYHNIQKALTENHGTQCGYCTSGMIMNMYALYKNNPNFLNKDVEDSFGGNICRCTGYRPILHAFKSLCKKNECMGQLSDIEDLSICPKDSNCNNSIVYNFEYPKWYAVSKIEEIFQIFANDFNLSYKLVNGNTGTGLFNDGNKHFQIFINIANVKELVAYKVHENCFELGSGNTISDCMKLFYQIGHEHSNYAYLLNIADHFNLIANVPVRNIGTIGGNLAMKYEHNEFQSDIFLILETIGAKIVMVNELNEIRLSPVDYLNWNMKHCLIKSIIFYPYDEDLYKFNTFKIMPTAENSYALIQAGFLIKIDKNIVKSARILYGCMGKSHTRAKSTETFISDRNIFDDEKLQDIYKCLECELKESSSSIYSIQLAISLFYKFLLGIAPSISDRNQSAISMLTRPLSSGRQEYSTNKDSYPLTAPISKIEAISQTSGEAKYITDMPDLPDQLYVAFVLTKAPPKSVVLSVDYSKALKLEGVVAYFDKNDIPGENNFMPATLYPVKEELFCSGVVQYYSQPIGIVVAQSQELAEKASDLINVKYQYSKDKPLLTIRDVLQAKDFDRVSKKIQIVPKSRGNDVKHVINGSFDIGQQYHFHMENQCCNVIPTDDDGFDMYPSTQHIDNVQAAAAAVLNLPANKFNISVKRIGGAFGAKISRNAICSSAAVLACYKLRKPVKLWLPMDVNMRIIGKRCPCSADYEVATDDDGKIQYLKATVYSDYGVGGNEEMLHFALDPMRSVYNVNTWDVIGYSVRTDTPAGTWCRAPGALEGYAIFESIMEHIAYTTNKDPLEVRLLNMCTEKAKYLKEYIEELEIWADLKSRKREVELFNKNNRWIKRGISITPNIYNLYALAKWPVLVTIYHIDGTVSVSHGGIEIGQGINTKALQVCAHAFGIPMEMVSIKAANNLISPNAIFTGASVTSEGVCLGILKACEVLLERMEPIKKKLGKPSWKDLVKEAYNENINLTAHFLSSPVSPEIKPYEIHLVCATEVEIDTLTGNYLLKRVDIVEDLGDSISPGIDVGQIEGAFVMGQGYWTTEEIKLKDSGEILNDNVISYKVPGAKDIPIDFRVRFSKYNPNPVGILKSKAVSEPPLTMSCSIPLAIRNAIASTREDRNKDKWCQFDGPTTTEKVFLYCLPDYKYYTL